MSAVEERPRLMEGYLKKKSPKGFVAKVWQTRYFVLYDDVLQYFRDKTDTNPAGIIPLQSVVQVNLQVDKKGGRRFDVVVGGEGPLSTTSSSGRGKDKDLLAKEKEKTDKDESTRIFSLLADTEAETDRWVKKLQELVQHFQESHKGLDIKTQGKFWKNTIEIREARAHSSQIWGDRRYLLEEDSKTHSGSLGEDDEAAAPPTPVPAREEDLVPFVVVKHLTDGPFGHVYTVKHKKTGLLYLMHALFKSDPQLPKAQQLFADMSILESPYIFQQVYSGEFSDCIFAIYTYAIDQSLFVHLRQHRRFPEHVARIFGAEVVLSLGYLHSQGRRFQNMGPEMIFLDEDGHACISDFLLCFDPEEQPHDFGTPEYATPEKLSGEKENAAADWWRLGVLLYELMVGIPPFRSKVHDAAELAEKIKGHRADQLRFPPFISKEGMDLIQALLNVDPLQRLGAGQTDSEAVKAHPFFSTINWNALSLRQLESPDWVDEMLQDERRRKAEKNQLIISSKEYQVEVKIIEARKIPGLKSDGSGVSDAFCVVRCENRTVQTNVVPNSVKPKWDQVFLCEVNQGGVGNLSIDLFHHEEGTDVPIGTVSVPLSEIRASKQISGWKSIIGADYISHGDLCVELRWSQRLGKKSWGTPLVSKLTLGTLAAHTKRKSLIDNSSSSLPRESNASITSLDSNITAMSPPSYAQRPAPPPPPSTAPTRVPPPIPARPARFNDSDESDSD